MQRLYFIAQNKKFFPGLSTSTWQNTETTFSMSRPAGSAPSASGIKQYRKTNNQTISKDKYDKHIKLDESAPQTKDRAQEPMPERGGEGKPPGKPLQMLPLRRLETFGKKVFHPPGKSCECIQRQSGSTV